MAPSTLIIVDLQRGFINEHTRHLPAAIERAQYDFDRVIATRYYHEPDSLLSKLLKIEGFEQGGSDTELAFGIRPDATVIEKCLYSCVEGSVLNELRKSGVQTVHVCGIDTDQCVLMTAADLFENGIRPVVLANLCASAAGPEYHNAGLRILKRLIGNEQVSDYRSPVSTSS